MWGDVICIMWGDVICIMWGDVICIMWGDVLCIMWGDVICIVWYRGVARGGAAVYICPRAPRYRGAKMRLTKLSQG